MERSWENRSDNQGGTQHFARSLVDRSGSSGRDAVARVSVHSDPTKARLPTTLPVMPERVPIWARPARTSRAPIAEPRTSLSMV